ncbi:polysialoglycoprotein-like [Rana temporaria]|nr:polysialoglycoprotein-like [Rana temporaria]XP_040190219.1 polysialoglycoprotein-like [Rana temporaria]XP_040204419.1 polysialoglycoprotein-like [Rana temporaria]
MAAIEDLFGRLRAEAAIRGEDWLQRQLGALLSQDGGDMGRMASGPSRVQTGQAASGPEHTGVVLAESGPERSVRGAVRAHGDTIQVASGPDHTGMGAASSGPSHTGRGASRTRSSRPPRRYSPSISPGRQRGDSGHSRAPSGPPAKRAAGIVSEGPAGGTRSSVGARGGRPGGSDAAALPARRVDQAVTGPVVGSRRVGSQATVASPPASSASHLQEVERVGSNRVTPSRKASAKSPHGSRARRGSESGPGPSASGTEPPGGSSSEEEDRSEGERSGSEDEVLPRTIPATRDSRRSADGIASTQPGTGPLLVWIMGHSYVVRGARRADDRPTGRQLGISRQEASVRWLGVPGMLWSKVVPEVHKFAQLDRPPEVLVIHAGGNDLGVRSMMEIARDIKFDFQRIRMSFPDTIVVWSDMVARSTWRMARSVEGVNRARRKINRNVGRFVLRNGGLVVRHPELEVDTWRYLRSDGVHLTDVGIDMWVLRLEEGVQQAMRVWRCSHR